MSCSSCHSKGASKSYHGHGYNYGYKQSACKSDCILFSGRVGKDVCLRFEKDHYVDPRTGAKYIVKSETTHPSWTSFNDEIPDTVPVFVLIEPASCDCDCKCKKDCESALEPPTEIADTCALQEVRPQV